MAKKKLKLPKRIAGVKIPKTVRKGPVADFLNSPGGQELIAEMLTLAGAAFPERGTAEATARLAHAFAEAARAFRTAMEDPSFEADSEDDSPTGPEAAADGEPAGRRKRKRSEDAQPAAP